MRFSTRTAKIIFIITALVLLVVATILYAQVKELVDANNSVNHINEVKLHLSQTLSAAKDAETAQRGFLLTNDSLFLQPYLHAEQKAGASINKLESLTNGNDEQQENLKKLQSLVNLKFSGFNSLIENVSQERDEIEKRQILLSDKSVMDSIRKQTNKMEIIEGRLMESSGASQIRHALFAPVATVLLVFLSLAVLAFSYYRITLDLKIAERHVSEMKSLNTELLAKNRQLQITNEELDSFNFITSHDLQEPVRKIRTFISIIEETDYDKLSEKSKHNFQRMQAASIRIQDLLQDLLTYSQLNEKNLEVINVDLNEVVGKVKEKLSAQLANTNAVIHNGQLPKVKGVAFQMEQLFEQLISNSLKYKRPEVAPEIKIAHSIISKQNAISGTLLQDNYHKISVSDNGLGFEQEQERKIFELFTQLHNKEYGGTGIGLTICKKIVQNHNGLIQARGKPNEGAVFEIYLPA